MSPVRIDANGFDDIGDTTYAPDIGNVQVSVLSNGATVVIGVWLNRNELSFNEHVRVYFNSRSGGDPSYGYDYLFSLDGYTAPTPDSYTTYEWSAASSSWTTRAFVNPSVTRYPNGRVYFQADFSPPGVGVRMRVRSDHPGDVSDYTPNLGSEDMFFTIAPRGLPDPLEGCTYFGSCVGPASGVGNTGPQPNPDPGGGGGGGQSVGRGGGGTSAACAAARRQLRSVTRKLKRARRAMRSARSRSAVRRHRRKVAQLKRTRSKLKRSVAVKC